jgi:hypothetical protein
MGYVGRPISADLNLFGRISSATIPKRPILGSAIIFPNPASRRPVIDIIPLVPVEGFAPVGQKQGVASIRGFLNELFHKCMLLLVKR